MDVTNYNNRLAQQRENFHDAHAEQKANHKREVDELKNRHDTQLAKQTENHKKNQQRIEEDNRKAIENSKDKTQAAVDAINKSYQAKLQEEQKNFDSERQAIRSQFDNRLNNLKDTYSTALEQREKNHSEQVKTMSDRHMAQSQKEKESFANSLGELQGRNEERFDVMREKEMTNKKALIDQNREKELELTRNFSDQNKARTRVSRSEMESLRENQAHEMESLKNRLTSQRKHDSRNIGAEVKDNTDLYNKKLNDEIELRKNRYNENMKNQLGEYNKEVTRLKMDKSDTIDGIRSAYGSSLAEELARNGELRSNQADSFKMREARNTQEYQKNINILDEQSRTAIEETKAGYNDKKKGILASNEGEKNQLVRNATISRNKMNSAHQEEQNRLRAVQQQEITQMKDHHSDSVKNVIANKDNQIEDIRATFTQNANESERRNTMEAQRSGLELSKTLVEKDQKQAQDLYNVRREYAERLAGGSELDRADARTKRVSEAYENRLGNTQNKMDEIQYTQQLERERLNAQQKAEMSTQRQKYENKIQDMDKSGREFQAKFVADSKEQSQESISQYRNQLNLAVVENEQQSIAQRQNANRSLDDQRVEYGRLINSLNERNQEALSQIQEDFSKEKTNYIESSRQDKHESKLSLRDDLIKSFERKETSYLQHMENKQKEFDRTVQVYETKISNLEKKNADEVNNLRRVENQRRADDLALFKSEQAALERSKNKEILEQRGQYEGRLERLRNTTNTQIQQLTDRYETMLRTQNQENTNTMNLKMKEAEANYARLHDQSQIERESLIQQYELRLDKMRMANQSQETTRSKRPTTA